MDHEPGDYLQIPITEDEREEHRRRSRSLSLERLLHDTAEHDSEKRYTESTPTRFPSIHSPGSRYAPPDSFQTFRSRANARYAPIDPADEEDIVDAVPLRQRTIYQAEETYQPVKPLPELWQPIWLRNASLALFALAFLALTAAVIVLWVVSRNRDGFTTAQPDSYRGWVYLPPVLMIIAIALWRPVDYYVKLLTPYDELQKGPVGPQRSLLLDYISPFQIVSLFNAFLHNHIPIGATVTTFVLLKIATLFSVGLFILLPTDTTKSDFPLLATSTFDASSFDADNLTSASSSPVYAFYASLAQVTQFQPGILANLVYSPIAFDNSSGIQQPANVTISGNVPAFFPNLDCHAIDAKTSTLKVTQQPNEDAFSAGNVTLTLPNGDTCSRWAKLNVTIFDPQTNIVPERLVQGYFREVYCATGTGELDNSDGPKALLYSIFDVSYTQDLFANASTQSGAGLTIASDSSWSIDNISSVICRPSYSIGNVKLTNDTTRTYAEDGALTIGQSDRPTNTSLDGFSAWNLTSAFQASVTAADNMFDNEPIGADEVQRASKTLFTMMALYYNTYDLSVLTDPGALGDAAQAVFEGIMSQYAAQNLVSPSSTNLRGTAKYTTIKYHVNEVSAIALIAALAVEAMSSLLLMFTGPRRVVPRDPSTIAALATTLTRSMELNRLLRREGVPSRFNQISALEGYEYGTAIATTESGQSSFKVVTSEGLPDRIRRPVETKLKWWRPLTSTIPFVSFVILVPIALIVVLEILQRSSDRNHGIHTVPDNEETELFSRFIPALVMLVVASLINLTDFNISLFTPWAKLRSGNATYRDSLLFQVFGRLPPFAFVEALRTRRFNLLLSFAATAVASVLTILVTGLLDVQNVTSASDGFSLTQQDQFQLAWLNSFQDDNGAAGLLSSILHGGVDHPNFVYNGLVLPQISTNGSSSFANDSMVEGSFVRLSVLRPSLRCDMVTSDSTAVTTASANETIYGVPTAFVTVQAPLPDSCPFGVDNATSISYQTAFNLPEDGSSIFGARQIDLLFGANASTYGNYGEFMGRFIGDNPPVGCPSLAFTFGEFSLQDTDSSRVTSMICYQQILQGEANVTFLSNTTSIDTSRPPKIDESSFHTLPNPNSTDDVHVFDWRIQQNLADQMEPFTINDLSDQNLDLFFQPALASTDPPTSPSSLIGLSNQTRLLNTILAFYRRYISLAISLNMRHPLSSNTTSPSLTTRQSTSTPLTTLPTTITTTRLFMSKPIKLSLQILLGLTSILTVSAYLLTPFHKVLPCNPCSIAGSMSLLAGSDLCHSIDDGSCECCGKPRRNSFGSLGEETIHADSTEEDGERKQVIGDGAEWLVKELWELVFAGKRYSMGWWRERGAVGRRRRFGVDVGARADGDDDQEWDLGKRGKGRELRFWDNRAEEGGKERELRFWDNRAEEGGKERQRSRGRALGRSVMGRGDRDGRGEYGMAGHSRGASVGYTGSPDPGKDDETYRMSGGRGGEA